MKTYLIASIPLICLFVFFGCSCAPAPSTHSIGTGILEKWKQSDRVNKNILVDVFFGPGNETIVACGGDISLYSCPDLALLKNKPIKNSVVDTAILPDRSFIVSVYESSYHKIRTSDLEINQTVHVKCLIPWQALDGSGMHDDIALHGVVLSDDSSVIALIGGDEISVWRMDGTKEIYKAQVPGVAAPMGIDEIAIAHKTKLLACSFTDANRQPVISLFDIDEKKQIKSFSAFTTYNSYIPYCLLFSPDDKHILSGSNDRNITIWDWKKGEAVGTLSGGHRVTVENMKFFPDGRHFASVGCDGSLCIWDFKERKLIAKVDTGCGRTYGLDISDDGKMIVVAGRRIVLFRVNLP